jgi:hypothetical protein
MALLPASLPLWAYLAAGAGAFAAAKLAGGSPTAVGQGPTAPTDATTPKPAGDDLWGSWSDQGAQFGGGGGIGYVPGAGMPPTGGAADDLGGQPIGATPLPPPTSSTPTAYLWASVKAGTYTTYTIVNGQAKQSGSLKTGGFSAEVKLISATQVDGTGTTTLMKILTGAFTGKLLYSRAPGITIVTRYR